MQIVEVGQRIAQHLARKLVENRSLLIPYETPHGETESEQILALDSAITKAKNKPNLDIQGLGIIKVPQTEQEVVALFNGLLGAGYLKGYQLLAVYGSTQKYDAIFVYNLEKKDENLFPQNPLGLPEVSFPNGKNQVVFPPSILEFKPVLSDLIDDFENDAKSFEDIKVAIAWDIGSDTAFQSPSQYTLEEIDHNDRSKQFYGETHILRAQGIGRPVHVILLKQTVEKIADTFTG